MAETDPPAVNLRKAGRDLNQIQRRLVWAKEHELARELVALKTKILERAEALMGQTLFELGGPIQ